jgi:hypothetical protein
MRLRKGARALWNDRFRNSRIVPENKVAADDPLPELSLSPRFISREESFEAYSMSTDLSRNKARFRRRAGNPVVYALAVAVFGLLSMLIVDHGPWSRRRDGDADNAQAGDRTGCPCSEAGSTDKSSDTIGPGFSCDHLPRERDSARRNTRSGSRQRMLTNAAHSAARIAPAKT